MPLVWTDTARPRSEETGIGTVATTIWSDFNFARHWAFKLTISGAPCAQLWDTIPLPEIVKHHADKWIPSSSDGKTQEDVKQAVRTNTSVAVVRILF